MLLIFSSTQQMSKLLTR